MITEIGHFALILALATAVVQSVVPLIGARRRDAGLMAVGPMAALTSLMLVAISFFALTHAYVVSDFSVQNVFENSHSLKPMLYKVTGVWGNHEGSMLLWVLILVLFSALVALFGRNLPDTLKANVLSVQAWVTVAFLLFVVLTSNPFNRLDPAPLEGNDLNPILQDIGLAIHPPLLYLGYVGFSISFAFAIAALIEGRIDAAWARWVRPWTLTAWIFLTAGISMGSYWAYYELGWGGWWFWDPVENASLMPWLIGAALMHSVVVTEKRGSFAAWTALLAVLAFLFSVMGAFLVRSGILTSVHAFAVDPKRGMLLLAGLLVYGGFALGLFALRAPKLDGGKPWEMFSREGALVANNVVLVVAALTVLLGTLFPLIAEAAGRTISVGEPYFRLTFVPMLALLLLILPVVQVWSWGKADLSGLWKWAAGGVGLVAVFLLLGVGLWDIPLGAAFGLALGVWLVFGAVWELKRRAVTPGRVFRLPLRVWGMTLAHMGLGVFIIGAVVETTQRYEATLALPVGGTGTVAGWTITLKEVYAIEGPNWYADRAELTARKDGAMAELAPTKRYYPAARMPTTETAIHKTGTGDLYIALGDRRDVGGEDRWVLRVYLNPLIDLVYLGVLLMGLGALFSLWPRRRRTADAS